MSNLHPGVTGRKAGPSQSDLSGLGDDRAMTADEFRAAYRIGRSTWKRLRARGDHPTLTWITERRYVIRPQHAREWLDARTSRPGEEA
jgi:hypothetical protein